MWFLRKEKLWKETTVSVKLTTWLGIADPSNHSNLKKLWTTRERPAFKLPAPGAYLAP